MRKLFHTAAVAALLAFSMAANAAEVGARPPVYAPPPIYVAPPFSWTGFYLGANIGGAWGRRNVTDSLFGLSLSNSVVKIEYDYLGLNSQTFTAPAGGFLAGDTFTTSNPNVQMVKVGANYLFKYGVGGY